MIRTATLWNCPAKTNGKEDFIQVIFIFQRTFLYLIICLNIVPLLFITRISEDSSMPDPHFLLCIRIGHGYCKQ